MKQFLRFSIAKKKLKLYKNGYISILGLAIWVVTLDLGYCQQLGSWVRRYVAKNKIIKRDPWLDRSLKSRPLPLD
jgi:hypothetical protein